MIIGIETKFDAGHHLPNYEGKCNRPHGHTWAVRVEVKGYVNAKTGMVIDFGLLKKKLNEVLDKFDHYYLNDFIKNPTCEEIVKEIYSSLVDSFDLESVQVKEGEGGWARL